MHRKTFSRVCAGLLLAGALSPAQSGPYDMDFPYGQLTAWDNGNGRFPPYNARPGVGRGGSGPGRNIWSPSQPPAQGQRAPAGQARAPLRYPPTNQQYPYPSQAAPARMQRGYAWQGAGRAAPTEQPRIEVALNESKPFVNQGVLYTVRVVSSSNLLTIKPLISGTDGFIVEKLMGPLTSSRSERGRNEIINEYRYLLTPIKAGEVEVPIARISGTMAGTQQWQYGRYAGSQGGTQSFDVQAAEGSTLNVRPALVSKVNPWLPLKALSIEGGLDPHEELKIGQPITYRIKLKANGAGGDKLPSIEGQLQGPGFQVYREDTQTRRILSRDGSRLTGIRTETFTLVPTGEGPSRVPTVRIPWWNVEAELREEAVLRSSGAWAAGGQAAMRPTPSAGFSFWTPLLLVITATLSYWLGMWARGTRFGQWASERVAAGIGRIRARLEPIFRFSSPRRVLFVIRRRFALLMPRSLRLWYCMRCIRKEQDPREWCHLFKFLACKQLNINEQTTLTDLADRIAEIHPGARHAVLRSLVNQLDGAIYGGMSFDFGAWKRKWARQLRPVWMPRLGATRLRRRTQLPALNPRQA